MTTRETQQPVSNVPAPNGPGASFVRLFDEDHGEGRVLPPEFQAVYAPWPLPELTGVPYTYVNFVTSRDGRVSFNEPGKRSGGPISGNSRHDRWLMGLLRARADAVLVGASALALTPSHRWTPEAIFPDDAVAWAALRRAEGRQAIPLHVVVTRSGTISRESIVLRNADIPALVVSTDKGLVEARLELGDAPNVQLLSTGVDLDYRQLMPLLYEMYGVRTLLSEAGPHVFGALLQAGVVHDEFVTLSPVVVGATRESWRPSLVEGAAFAPDMAPRSRLLATYRADDLLFLHSRYGGR